MLELLLLVIGCYVAAALSVHLAYRFRNKRKQSGKHYVLITDDRQQNMEWVMRSLFAFSRRMGKDVRLTIVDRGVSEETRAIVDRMARGGQRITVLAREDELQQKPEVGKRLQMRKTDATQLMWHLQAKGVVSQADQAVLIDLQNPSDLSKMPF